MKVLVITGSRADRNGLEVVHEALLKAGHESILHFWNGLAHEPDPDVVVLGGDRFEILESAVWCAEHGYPIAHIAGGDRTVGSADDRYRDAITSLACIHFPTNDKAFWRLLNDHMEHKGDIITRTGSPAIDRIHQTPINPDKADVLSQFCMQGDKPVALVCVHPNTDGQDALTDFRVVGEAMVQSGMQCIWLGANADEGGQIINWEIQDYCRKGALWTFRENVSPQMYYSLMAHCDVMVGNSSAMVYEAPSFGLPCVLVGERQAGRLLPVNVLHFDPSKPLSLSSVIWLNSKGRVDCENPYGDGKSAPRIVRALEEWHELREGMGSGARVEGNADRRAAEARR